MNDFEYPDILSLLGVEESTLGVNSGPYVTPIGPMLQRAPIPGAPVEYPECDGNDFCVIEDPVWAALYGR